jgi:hypothetical protein
MFETLQTVAQIIGIIRFLKYLYDYIVRTFIKKLTTTVFFCSQTTLGCMVTKSHLAA